MSRAFLPSARAVLAAATAGVIVLGLAGCSAAGVTVDYTRTAATVERGGELTVSFGTVNSSVGDDWVLISEPDPEVLGEGEKRSEYLGEKHVVGAPNTLAYRFPAVGPGTTTLEFEYRFRGEVPEDPAEQKTSTIAVTVE